MDWGFKIWLCDCCGLHIVTVVNINRNGLFVYSFNRQTLTFDFLFSMVLLILFNSFCPSNINKQNFYLQVQTSSARHHTLKGVLCTFKGFVRISKYFLDVYILHYFQKMPCRFLNVSTILWRVVYYWEIGFTNLFHYGQTITQFIYVSLICRTTNNAMFVFFKVSVGQSLTQIIFYSVLDSENCLNSFKRWIC